MTTACAAYSPLTTEFVDAGKACHEEILNGKRKACWDCHRDVPHTRISNLASAPNALAPFPVSPVPKWLKELME